MKRKRGRPKKETKTIPLESFREKFLKLQKKPVATPSKPKTFLAVLETEKITSFGYLVVVVFKTFEERERWLGFSGSSGGTLYKPVNNKSAEPTHYELEKILGGFYVVREADKLSYINGASLLARCYGKDVV